MKKGAVTALIGVAIGQAFGIQDAGAQEVRGNGLIVDAAWVAQELERGDVVVLQVGPPDLFAQEHIAGARPLVHQDLAVRGDLVLELPPVDDLQRRLGRLGIGDDSRIVVVHAAQWITPTTRVVFTLDYAGFGDRTYVLDGGLEAWKAAGMPVTSTVAEARPATVTRPVADRVVTHEWVQAHARDERVSLVDARAPAFYDGVRDDDGLVGHIDGAVSLPWQEIVRQDGDIVWFRSDDEIAQVFMDAGVGEGDLVVGYCHIGQFATGALFGARVTGHPVRLFDGSMDQWRKLGLPLTTEPR